MLFVTCFVLLIVLRGMRCVLLVDVRSVFVLCCLVCMCNACRSLVVGCLWFGVFCFCLFCVCVVHNALYVVCVVVLLVVR